MFYFNQIAVRFKDFFDGSPHLSNISLDMKINIVSQCDVLAIKMLASVNHDWNNLLNKNPIAWEKLKESTVLKHFWHLEENLSLISLLL